MKLAVTIPKESVDFVRDIQDSLSESNQHSGDDNGLWPCGVDSSKNLLKIIESVRPVSMSRNDGLVLDCYADLVDIWIIFLVRFTDKQIHFPPSIPRRRDVRPHLDLSFDEIRLKGRTYFLEILDDTVTYGIRVCFEAVIVIPCAGNLLDSFIERCDHNGDDSRAATSASRAAPSSSGTGSIFIV